MQAKVALVHSWPTFPGDPARRQRTHTKKPKARLQGVSKFAKSSERHGQWGRMMEDRVSNILERMVAQGLILRFVYHEPNSEEDRQGKDFTVWKMVEGQEQEYSFGITISKPGKYSLPFGWAGETLVPLWYLPINTNDETIVKKVLAL